MSSTRKHYKLLVVSSIFSSLWIFGSSDIYRSIQWTSSNPIFINTTNTCKKPGEIPEIRVRIQSLLPVICPNPNIIMQTLPRAPDKTTLYSNLWITYDNKSFDTCDVNTTHNFNPQRGWTNKILLRCDEPLTLKEYTIKFSMSGATSKDLEYEPGRYYYFLATSDGTSDSINNTKGGHCDDKRTGLRLKFKVYLCRDATDPMCTKAKIGEFICPSDYETSPSLSPSPSVTTGHQSLTTLPSPSSAENCVSTITHECTIPTKVSSTQTNYSVVQTVKICTTQPPLARRAGDCITTKERDFWRNLAISIIIIVFVVLAALPVIYACCRNKKCCKLCPMVGRSITPEDKTHTEDSGFTNNEHYIMSDTAPLDLSYSNPGFDSEDGNKTKGPESQTESNPESNNASPCEGAVLDLPKMALGKAGPGKEGTRDETIKAENTIPRNDPVRGSGKKNGLIGARPYEITTEEENVKNLGTKKERKRKSKHHNKNKELPASNIHNNSEDTVLENPATVASGHVGNEVEIQEGTPKDCIQV